MGLKLRVNLFLGVDAPDVFTAFSTFYGRRHAALVPEDDRERRYDLRRRQGRWCVLEWNAGWEWRERREAQLYVAQTLRCPGLLVFVDDGLYWGYELFTDTAEDHFIQWPEKARSWFPNEDCKGDADLLSAVVSWRRREELAAYVMQRPNTASDDYRSKCQALDVPVRPGDQFRRFDECAVVDFLRALDVAVNVRDQYVQFDDPLWKSFRVEYGRT
jgi:hypothetical protein